jgi:hypothetical protein
MVLAWPKPSDAPNPAMVWYVVAPLMVAVSAAEAGTVAAKTVTVLTASNIDDAVSGARAVRLVSLNTVTFTVPFSISRRVGYRGHRAADRVISFLRARDPFGADAAGGRSSISTENGARNRPHNDDDDGQAARCLRGYQARRPSSEVVSLAAGGEGERHCRREGESAALPDAAHGHLLTLSARAPSPGYRAGAGSPACRRVSRVTSGMSIVVDNVL